MEDISKKAIAILRSWFGSGSDAGDAVQEDGSQEDGFPQGEIEAKDVAENLAAFDRLDADAAWQNIQNAIQDTTFGEDIIEKNEVEGHSVPKVISLLQPFLKYAAVVAGISFGILYFMRTNTDGVTNNTSLLALADRGTVTLKRADDTISEFIGDTEMNITNANGKTIGSRNGKELRYFQDSLALDQPIAIHELSVPKGKTFRVVLSDGTKVYCDAGTTLTYPSRFKKGSPRKVQLIGQAYFDVAKSKTHPFIVSTGDADVKVLGTQFNVSAYPESKSTQTVLVEGSVLVSANGSDKMARLIPGQKASVREKSKKIAVNKVNTYDYTAWMSQKLVFKRTPFHRITKALERKFAVTITNENQLLDKQLFTAKFDTENLTQILEAFKVDAQFRYSVADSQIIIH